MGGVNRASEPDPFGEVLVHTQAADIGLVGVAGLDDLVHDAEDAQDSEQVLGRHGGFALLDGAPSPLDKPSASCRGPTGWLAPLS
jgi:hypothetical protein